MKHRVARWAVTLLAGSLALVSNAQTSLSPADRETRAQAVLAARAGQFESSLSVLESLVAAYPGNQSLLVDQAAVLAWAERDSEALSLAADLALEETPAYAALAIAKSARNLQQYDEALRWYEAASIVEPENADPLLGLALTHADLGDTEAIRSALDRIAAGGFRGPAIELARGYALRILGDSFAALAAYESVLADEPQNREALRGKALVLRSMLLPTQALELAEQYPGILTDTEIARLRSDEAAIRVRLAGRTPMPPPASLAASDNALEFLESYLVQESDPGASFTLQMDRVVALSDAKHAEEAIAAFESLPPEDAWSQPYVLGAVAHSYLEAQRPEDALSALEAALQLSPENTELRFALVYTYLDLERFQDALALSHRLATELPKLNQSSDGAVVKINHNWLTAELLAGVAEAYADQLAAAQQRFEELLAEAPANADARHELANVYRWRGWLDKALSEYRQVLANDAGMLSARLGHAHAQIDAREYEAVDAAVTEIAASYPREPAAERLAERWTVHNRSELDVAGSSARSSGSTFGSDSFSLDAHWYTAPVAYRYRAFVHTHDATATFPEGSADRRRLGTGLEYKAPRWIATGEISGDRDGGAVGIAGAVDWRLSDTWTLAAQVELDTDEVQLRAHRLGIESDLGRISARYAASESFDAQFGLEHHRLSDSNRQRTLYADMRYRVANAPRWKIDLTGHIGSSASDQQAVPYFSPERASTMLIGLRHEYRLYRRYERDVSHRVELASGRYDQALYPGGSIWRFAYELRWQVSDSLAVGIGARRSGDWYDGLREHSTSAVVTLNARF